MTRQAARPWWGPAALLAAVVGFFLPWFIRGEVPYWGDLVLQFYPTQAFVRSIGLPLWNPHIGAGVPLAGLPHSGLFYPPNLIFRVLPVGWATVLTLMAHLVLAGVGMYAFLRKNGLTPGAATFGSMAFMLSARFVTQLSMVARLQSQAWLPWIMLATCVLVADRRPRHVAWLGLAVGIQLLAGHTQITYMTLLLAGTYGLWHALTLSRPTSLLRPFLLPFASAVVLGAMFAAILVLPVAEYVNLSLRGGGLDYQAATDFSLTFRHLAGLILPHLFGSPHLGNYQGDWNYWEMAWYVGIAPLVFAAFVLWRKPLARFLSVAVFVTLILALGRYTPVYRFAYALLPGLALFRDPSMFLFLTVFCLSSLGGIGLDFLSRELRVHSSGGPSTGRVGTGLVAGGLATGFIALLWLRMFQTAEASAASAPALSLAGNAAKGGVVVAAVLVGLGLILALYGRGRLSTQSLAVAVAVLAFGDLYVFGAGFNPTVRPEAFAATPSTARLIREMSRGSDQPYRHVTLSDALRRAGQRHVNWTTFLPGGTEELRAFLEFLSPNTAMLYGTYDVKGYEPLAPRRVVAYTDAVARDFGRRGGASKLLDYLGVKFVITYQRLDPLYYRLLQDSPVPVYENLTVLPRALAVRAFQVVSDDQALGVMATPSFELEGEVLLDRPPSREASPPPGRAGTVRFLSYSPGEVALEANMDAAGFVVLSDAFSPGWQATVDGRPVSIYRANYMFRAVSVPAGTHQVRFVYRPTSVRVGFALSIVGFLALVVLFRLDPMRNAGRPPSGTHG